MPPFDLPQLLADELGIARWQAANTLELLDEGNTVPFIARYRKERTGELDEEVLWRLSERAAALRTLEERRQEVRRLLAEQEKLTPELEEALAAAQSLQRIEDLYRPYRPKRRTRAQIAREKGLAPLAEADPHADVARRSLSPQADEEQLAAGFVDPEKGVATPEEALSGALDIVAEDVSDDPDIRSLARELTRRKGALVSERANDGDPEIAREYETYFDFSEAIGRLRPHQVLAINRGERQGALKVRVEIDPEIPIDAISELLIKRQGLRPSAMRGGMHGSDHGASRRPSRQAAHPAALACDRGRVPQAPRSCRRARYPIVVDRGGRRARHRRLRQKLAAVAPAAPCAEHGRGHRYRPGVSYGVQGSRRRRHGSGLGH